MVVAPDGSVTIFRIGLINVRNRQLEEVTAEIATKLGMFYDKPEVNLAVKTYANNKAFVLGRVANPGVVHFSGDGTLIEALSLSGGLPVVDTGAFLSKCAIIRGKQEPLWIDLRKLLQAGDMSLNVRLQNNDIVFIPESEDETVYVLGEVLRPGPVKLKSQLTLLDVLTACGGPSKYANREKIFIIRSDGKTGVLKTIDLKKMLATGDMSQDYILRHSDIVYVPPTRIAQFNDVLQSLTPALQFLNLSAQSLEYFGVMAQLRQQLWGQQGFVNSGSSSGSGGTGN
jgi:polysaccharide export outer membrane protein